jgi:putative transposase
MRRNRILKDGAEYHVTARINRGEMIFLSKDDRDMFMKVLKRAKQKFKFQIKNFCIMGNHIHLLIKPGIKESLSKIMQWLLGVFAQLWNKKHHLTGHLWGDRFFSRIILGIIDFLRVFMYIDDNPVIANMVERSWQWEYGGLWYHRKGIKGIIEEPESITVAYFPEHSQIFKDQ